MEEEVKGSSRCSLSEFPSNSLTFIFASSQILNVATDSAYFLALHLIHKALFCTLALTQFELFPEEKV